MGERSVAHGIDPLPLVTTDFESRPADWLGVTEAEERVMAAATPLLPERADLQACLGRALAEDVIA